MKIIRTVIYSMLGTMLRVLYVFSPLNSLPYEVKIITILPKVAQQANGTNQEVELQGITHVGPENKAVWVGLMELGQRPAGLGKSLHPSLDLGQDLVKMPGGPCKAKSGSDAETGPSSFKPVRERWRETIGEGHPMPVSCSHRSYSFDYFPCLSSK